MTTELWMLVLSAVLAPVLVLPGLVGRSLTPGGTEWSLGNREKPLEVAEWISRASRAHANLIENLPTFAALVLTAHVLNKHSVLTVWGAIGFFAFRVLHALVYIVGIKHVRTLVFILSLVSEILILVELVKS